MPTEPKLLTDAPENFSWKCPDCGSMATLGDNATYHRNVQHHGQPSLVPFQWGIRTRAPSPSPGAPAEWMRKAAEEFFLYHYDQKPGQPGLTEIIAKHAPACDADKARLDKLETIKLYESRDGGWSGFFQVNVPARAWGPWAAEHGGEYDYKTLREALDALPAPPAAAKEGE